MKKEIFKMMYGMEETWWYLGRRSIVSSVLNRFLNKKTGNKILDFGSGYGGMYTPLSRFGSVCAYEPESVAAEVCKGRGYSKVFGTTQEAFSAKNCLGLIGAFDVMEHIENDIEFVNQAYKALDVGGQIIITVPAYQWLWNVHDEDHKHFRRYTECQVIDILKGGGFTINYSSYWNTMLFIPAALTRLLGFSGVGAFTLPSFINRVLYYFLVSESVFIPRISIPFGLSIIVIAEKK